MFPMEPEVNIGSDNGSASGSRWWWCILQFSGILHMAAWYLPTTPKVEYAAWRYHAAPTTKQLHLHLLINFKNCVKFTQMQAMGYLNCKWLTSAQHKQNCRTYLEDDLHADGSSKGVMSPAMEEYGEWNGGSEQGKRNDLGKTCEMIAEGKTMKQVATEYPTTFVRNYRGLAQYELLVKQPSGIRLDIKVIVHYGIAGSGKTRRVYDTNNMEDIFRLPMSSDKNIWFDGYHGQKVLILDDCVKRFKYHDLLNYLDIYPLTLPTKGGHAECRWEKVYITHTDPPERWYTMFDDQLDRRIKEIWFFDKEQGISTFVRERPPPSPPGTPEIEATLNAMDVDDESTVEQSD